MPSYTNIKDPEEKLDYGFDLTDWLNDGCTIAASSWTVETGLTEVDEAATDTQSAVMISGGTENTVYSLKGAITDSEGRVMVRRISLYCLER